MRRSHWCRCSHASAWFGLVLISAVPCSWLRGVPHINVWIEAVLTVPRLVSLIVLVPMFGALGAATSMAIIGLVEEVAI